jgi:ATP-dependent Clp protease adaptor protein ClpS
VGAWDNQPAAKEPSENAPLAAADSSAVDDRPFSTFRLSEISGPQLDENPGRSDLHAAGQRVHSQHVTITFSNTLPKEETRTELALEGIWRVVVLNDPVNLMSYVVMVFKKVFGFDEQTARQKMLEVHEQGRSIVWSGLREKAEAYVFTLQQWHLTAVLEPDETH